MTTQLGARQRVMVVRLSAKDAASIKKLARSAQVTVSAMVRTLIRRAQVAKSVAA
jgi:hypothetical protein